MKNRLCLAGVLAIGFIFLVQGCAPQYTIKAEDKASVPITATLPKNMSSLVVTKVVIAMTPGKRVGSYYDGLAKVRQWDYTWGVNFIVDPNKLLAYANKYLKAQGFPVPTRDTGDVSGAEFILEAYIENIAFNYFGKMFAGNYSESLVQVRWLLRDAFTNKVIYTATTKGYGTFTGLNIQALFNAFGASLGRVVSEDKFLQTLRPQEETPLTTAFENRISIPRCKVPRGSPSNLEELLPSIVMVKNFGVLGSGFIISSDGWVLTAEHVVKGTKTAIIELISGTKLKAKVVRTNMLPYSNCQTGSTHVYPWQKNYLESEAPFSL